MNQETKEKLAGSLTAETTELLPYLPYLLQDFWELGSDPGVMVRLIERYVELPEGAGILDLACGKGSVAVRIADKLRVKVKGIDLLSDFIEFAAEKAKEYGVGDLCEFVVGDINEAVESERGYDAVILGAVGCNVLGGSGKTLDKLKKTIKPGGYILIDESYLPDDIGKEDVLYGHHEYLTEGQWKALFKEVGLEIAETVVDFEDSENLDSVSGMAFITARANELIEKYPNKKEIFEGYVRSQRNEYADLDSNLAGVVWILKKID